MRPKSRKTRIQVYVPPRLGDAFRNLAVRFERTESDLARIILENFVKVQHAKERARLEKQDGK